MEAVKSALARFNAGDLESYLDIFDRSVIFHGLGRGLKPGVAGLKDYYTQLRAGFPDMRLVGEDLFAEGEKVASRYTFYGTHRGECFGVAPTGKLVVSPGIVIHHFRNGKCFETWHSTDTLGFLSQIGAVEQPAQKR